MIIGLCGYGQVGKDTAFKELLKIVNGKWWRIAFADPLKQDIAPLIAILKMYRPDFNPDSNPEHKKMLRDLYESWGTRTCRAIIPEIWSMRAEKTRQELMRAWGKDIHVVFTDVRDAGDIRYIKSIGGEILYIERPGVGPAAPIEATTIAECLNTYGALRDKDRIINDGTPADLGLKFRTWISEKFNVEFKERGCALCGEKSLALNTCKKCSEDICAKCSVFVLKKGGILCLKCR